MSILTFLFLTGQIFFAVFFFFLVVAFVTGGPFVPSSKLAVSAMINLGKVGPGMRVYDLGSGDGRLVAAAKKKGAKATGFEINPILVLYANLRGRPTRWASLWRANLSDADIVFAYLLPGHMDKLMDKLKRQCKKGTLVISNSFIFPNWKALRSDEKNHIYAFMV